MFDKAHFERLIVQSRFRDLFRELKPLVQHDDMLSTMLNTLNGTYDKVHRGQMMGIFSNQEAILEENKLRLSLLDFLKQVQDSEQTHASSVRKILFLAANPSDTTSKKIGEELREIEDGLKMSQNRDNIKLESRHAIRVRDLRRSLLEVKPQILHFSGQGTSKGELIIEADRGGSIALTPESVGDLLGLFKETVECVVLNACFSEEQANEIVKHIPFVVGMNNNIDDDLSIEFSLGFYDSLGAGEDFEMAFEMGKTSIGLAGGDKNLVVMRKK
ncbi:MAG: CHAT domain-containing protein [Bacteroidetes bacterium]|nr:CHAT domain-containing protein [Bacteroidota bacterium]MCB0854504.1 CHAT domain-containing protein [Bacteroidota bacterium]